MTETKGNQTFQSEFHRRYVGGEGEVVEKPVFRAISEYEGVSYEKILAEYRWYMRDAAAELPEEIMEMLKVCGKV